MSQTVNAPGFETIVVSADGPIGRLTLNRPEKRNALSTQVLEEIVRAANWFDAQAPVRAVLVTGAGGHFSAGADLGSFSGSAPRSAADAGRLMADAVESMRAIAIAEIRGWCVGGALVLAAACDLRVAADDAQFSIPEVDLGIPLAWGGIPRLVREVGPAFTKELVITCRVFGAAEALGAGFLNRVVPEAQLASEALGLAEAVATKAPVAVEATKRHVNAVTAQMVGTMRAWNDADSLIGAMHDEEARKARLAYLAARGR